VLAGCETNPLDGKFHYANSPLKIEQSKNTQVLVSARDARRGIGEKTSVITNKTRKFTKLGHGIDNVWRPYGGGEYATRKKYVSRSCSTL